LILQHTREAELDVAESIAVSDSSNVNIVGCQVTKGRKVGIAIMGSSVVRIADCTIQGERIGDYRAAVRVDEKSSHVMVMNNFLARGTEGTVVLPNASGTASGNMPI
jgi:parallel beta-helix repeat protein